MVRYACPTKPVPQLADSISLDSEQEISRGGVSGTVGLFAGGVGVGSGAGIGVGAGTGVGAGSGSGVGVAGLGRQLLLV